MEGFDEVNYSTVMIGYCIVYYEVIYLVSGYELVKSFSSSASVLPFC